MDLLDLFRPNKEFKRASLRPKSSSNYAPSESSAVSITSSHIRVRHVETGTDYVKRYVEEEDRLALEVCKLFTWTNSSYRYKLLYNGYRQQKRTTKW